MTTVNSNCLFTKMPLEDGNYVVKMINEFTDWFQFCDYKEQPDINLAGVYVLAHFERVPKSAPKLASRRIVYIGETTGQTIGKRLYQFSNSAFRRKNGHSGGWTYSELYLNAVATDDVPRNLFVSFLPVDRPETEAKAYIKYIERLLIWEFFKKNRDYPSCNTT